MRALQSWSASNIRASLKVLSGAFALLVFCSILSGEDALLSSGIRLAQEERYAEAADIFRRCLLQDPNSFEAHYDLALALFALGRLPESRQAIDQVPLQTTAETDARQYLLGKIDDAAGDTVRAREELSAAFRATSTDENRAIDYGVFLLRQGDYRTAAATFSGAMEVHRQSLYVQLGLAMAQAFGGLRTDAVLTCRRILQIRPNFSPALLLMAFAHYMSGAYPEAERVAAKGLQQSSPAPYLYYLHAAALEKMNSTSYHEMLGQLEEAERGIVSCTLCYFVSSKVHERAGDFPAAVADLRILVTRVAPGFDQAWYRLGVLYRREGREAEARAAFARFRTIRANGGDPEVELARGSLLPKEKR